LREGKGNNMAIRKIVVLGEDDILRKHARVVEKFDRRLHTLLSDMAETMYEAQGVGLAAPQVGILKRVAVIDVEDEHGLIELVNPVIVESEGSVVGPEGCLSVPGRRGTVERPERIVVVAQDRNGQSFRLEAKGLLAVCICHEVDHLDGVVYTDKMIEDVTDQETEAKEE